MTLRKGVAGLGLLLFVAGYCSGLHAMMEADKFVGAWRLVSTEYRTDDGAPAESPYGAQPRGLLMYDAYGSMSAQLAQNDRKPFATADRLKGSAEEIKAAYESYQAYYGTYKVDERDHVVIHTVTQALFPNWAGTEQRREYKFQDGKLILRTPPILFGGKRLTGVLVWEKIKPQ
jgi:hypothetical protein